LEGWERLGETGGVKVHSSEGFDFWDVTETLKELALATSKV